MSAPSTQAEAAERRTGGVHQGIDVAKVIRIALDNPELSTRRLGIRFSISTSRVLQILKDSGRRDEWRAKRLAMGVLRGERDD